MPKLKKIQGTGTALVTPFKKNGSVDEAALADLVEFQIRGRVEAIIPMGTTGENPTMSQQEQEHFIRLVVEFVRGRALVIAGAGSNSTQKAIEMTRFSKEAAADGALIVGPYYNKPTQEGYFRHYLAIAEAVDLPLVVYNVPGRTGGNIEAETTLRLAEEIPQVVAVKEASGNISQIMEIARNRPKQFSLLSGDDAFTLPVMAVGGDGCISVVANEVPGEFSEMVRLCLGGKWDKALKLHNRLLPLMNANFLESNPIPVKAALAMMGMIDEVYRLPLVEMKQANREKLKRILSELELI